jgi:KUP system potassium uptake protein
MTFHVKHNRALHQHLFALTMVTRSTPWVRQEERLTIVSVAPDFWRGTARYGFMETPDIPKLLRDSQRYGCTHDNDDVTYYVGHETVLHRTDGTGLPFWRECLFAFLQRNSAHISEFVNLPRDAVVEIGRQIEI